MGLCYVCNGIPFEHPPSLPPPYVRNLPGQPVDPANLAIFFVESDDPNYNAPPYGYLHWQSETDLIRSARSCGLCHLIHQEFLKNATGAPDPIGHHNFFVTRRENNQAGFQVWTQANRPLTIWRVGAFGYSVEDENDALAYTFRGRRIHQHSSGPKAKNIAKEWLEHCVKYHDLCGPQGGTPRLPTRVLDVGPPNSAQLKLWETNGARHNYTILSYTWGPPSLGQDYKTTHQNIARYQNGIDIVGDGIPQTIIDAIEITRMMKIRYLWVDALCIRQDNDHKDFNVESLKMLDYYGNSYLTITAAASSDAYAGVFNDRDPPKSTSFSYTSRSGYGTMIVTVLDPYKENLQPEYFQFPGNPIMTRAWTLQERVLSTRNIFYAIDQMYYECNQHFLSEDGLLVHGRQLSTNPKTQDLDIYKSPRATTNLWRNWDLLLLEYGGRQMQDPKRNKFVAICGLAKRFGHLFRGGAGHYHAGLWKHRLIQQLFWQTNTKQDPDATRSVWHRDWPPMPENYRAPSWSWACTDMPILNPDGRIYLAELYATHENSSITTVQADDYGQISDAQLTIRAPLLHLIYLRGYTQQGMEAHDWGRYDDPGGVNIAKPFSTTFDYEFHHSQLQELDVYALVLGRDSSLSQDGVQDVNYLCILVTKADWSTYRRMGIIWLDEFSMGDHAIRYVDGSEYQEFGFV